MARSTAPRKKRTIIDEVLENENESNDTSSDISDLVIVASKVYKLNNAKRSFCFQTSEAVDEVSIQTQYPSGGAFVVIELNGNGEIVNTVNFDIEPKPLIQNSNSNGNGNSNGPMDFQIQMLRDELLHYRQMVLTLISNRGSEQTPINELVQAMQGLNGLASGKDPVEMILKGMELANKTNGGGGGDWKTELISTAKEAVVPVIQMLNANNRAQQNPPMNNQTPAQLPEPNAMIRQALKWLKSKILTGMDVGLAVDWLIQNANDPQYQPILSMAVQGNIDNFIALDTEIGNDPYRQWFTTAIQLLKEWYAEQSNDSSDMGGGVGDHPNPTVDAKANSRKSNIKKVG